MKKLCDLYYLKDKLIYATPTAIALIYLVLIMACSAPKTAPLPAVPSQQDSIRILTGRIMHYARSQGIDLTTEQGIQRMEKDSVYQALMDTLRQLRHEPGYLNDIQISGEPLQQAR